MNKKLQYHFKLFRTNRQKKTRIYFSGFNTLKPYARISDKNRRKRTQPDKGSLLKSLENLIIYLEDLSNLIPESANHDLHLKNILDIKKNEILPTLPEFYKSEFRFTQGKLYFIYKMVVGIHEDFISLQDLFHISGNTSNYKPLIQIEKLIIEALLDSMKIFLYNNIQDKKLSEQYLKLYLDFDKSLQGISEKNKIDPWDRTIGRITDYLYQINERNERIYRRITSLTEAGTQSKINKKPAKNTKFGVTA